jgi:hypothetical protein
MTQGDEERAGCDQSGANDDLLPILRVAEPLAQHQ